MWKNWWREYNRIFESTELIEGQQIWDGNVVKYNYLICPTYFKQFSNGIGLSMNLSNDAAKTM